MDIIQSLHVALHERKLMQACRDGCYLEHFPAHI
jgi:hypothetical protein